MQKKDLQLVFSLLVSTILVFSSCTQKEDPDLPDPSSDPRLRTGIAYGSDIDTRSVAVDAVGNSYVVGDFFGEADFGDTTLTTKGPGIFIASYNQKMELKWIKTIEVTNILKSYDIALDNKGSFFITGTFWGGGSTIPFDSQEIRSYLVNSIFLAKYSTEGNLQWVQSVGGGTSTAEGHNLAVDALGNAYITGDMSTNYLEVGDIPVQFSGNKYNFVMKYSSSGVFQWVKGLGDNVEDLTTNDIAVDGSGNTYVTGRLKNTVNLEDRQLTAKEEDDIVIIKYNTNGQLQWATNIGGSGTEYAKSIKADGSGNVYVTGLLHNGGTFGSTQLETFNYLNGFLAKYTSAGQLQWVKSNPVEVNDMAIDKDGEIYLAGGYSGSFTYGSGTVTSKGADDAFVVKYSGTGEVVWVKNAGGAERDIAFGLDVDQQKNVYVFGYFDGWMSNKSVFGTTELAAKGGTSYFLWKVVP